MGSVGKKIKKVVKKVMRPKVLLPLAAIALGGPALMGGLKSAALGTAATPMGAVLHGTASMAPATSGFLGAGGKLALGKGSIAKGIGALMKSPVAQGVMKGLKNPFSVPGALTYGGLGALGMMLGSKDGPEQGSDPVDRAALNQANYNMMRMYGEKAGYTDDEINTIYGPLGQMMGGEYTEVAANPNQRRRIQYPGTNYPIYTTQGAADGGRIGFMDGDIVGTEQMDDEELQRQLILDALFPEGSPGANEDAIAEQMYNMQMQEMMNPNMGKADGGRIGLEGGGMSNIMMASAPDPMAERMDMMENLALDRFGKPLEMLNDREYIELEDLLQEMTPMATGGRVNRNMGGIMNAGSIPQTMQNPIDMGMQLDGRGGGFIPMGTKPRADDVPAMLSKDEFVMTRDAVKGLGDGDVNVGAQKMYDLMNQLEAKV